MNVAVKLAGLGAMHPRLLWDEIAAATAAVLGLSPGGSPARLQLEFRDIPGFDSDQLAFEINAAGIAISHIARVRRTYEPPRLIELSAVAVAALALYHSGGHEIVDVAVRGTAADYLVDAAHLPLEVAGRSQRSDFELAWRQKWERLKTRAAQGFYVCVAEFETPSGRLASAP